MNSKLGKIMMSAVFVLVCWGVADAQRKGAKGPKEEAIQVNAGWATLAVEIRDILTDELVQGTVNPVEFSKSYAITDPHGVVLEVQADGYVGLRDHVFVVAPDQKETYRFTLYMHRPPAPAPVQHMAQID